jgi:hypothetical protein
MRSLFHPAQAVALGFLAAIAIGTLLLQLPVSHVGGEPVPWLVALFTSVTAVCVTGLVIVDTGTYWSTFGQAVIMVLFQIGGFGMMTAATLLGLIAASAHQADHPGRNPFARPGRHLQRHQARPGRHAGRGTGDRRPAYAALSLQLRPAAGRCRLERGVPCGVGLQQCRLLDP